MSKKQKVVFFLAVSLISLVFLLGNGKEAKGAWIENCYWICDGELLWCGGGICVVSEEMRAYYGYTGYGLCRPGDGGCAPEDLGGHYGWLCRNSCTGEGWCDNNPEPPLGFRCHYISYWYCSGTTPKAVWDSVMNSGCSDAGEISCATNGVCGPDNGKTLASTPTNLCFDGLPSIVFGSGPWDWNCFGSGGGSSVSCSANAVTINGACSTPNHTWTLCSKPRSSLCSAGTPSIVNGTGIPDWWWTCAGSNGGLTDNCWAKINTCGDGQVACGEQCDLGAGNGAWPSTCSSSCTTNTCPPNCNDSDNHCGAYTGNCGQPCSGTKPTICTGSEDDCNKSCGGGTWTETCFCPDKTITHACNSHPCPPGYREVAPW